jgi:hypothetical protein
MLLVMELMEEDLFHAISSDVTGNADSALYFFRFTTSFSSVAVKLGRWLVVQHVRIGVRSNEAWCSNAPVVIILSQGTYNSPSPSDKGLMIFQLLALVSRLSSLLMQTALSFGDANVGQTRSPVCQERGGHLM